MAHHDIGGLAFAVEDANEGGRIVGLAVDHHIGVGHLDLAIAHDLLDLPACHSASAFPFDKIADAQLIRFCAFHVTLLLVTLPVIIAPFRIISVIHAVGDVIGPSPAGVATPQGPRNSARRGIALLAGAPALSLLVHLMAGEIGHHALHRVEAELASVADVTSSGDAHLGAAASVLLAPRKAALGLFDHAVGGGGVDFYAFIGRHRLPPPAPPASAAPRRAPARTSRQTAP